MAALYLDTSALVKRYVQETGSSWISTATNASAQNVLYILRVTAVEMIAAITRKARMGDISPTNAATAITNFRADLSASFSVVEITPALAQDAMRLAERHALRAYDALQLGGAVQINTERVTAGLILPTFISADVNLNRAARAEGLSVDDPNAHP